MLGDSARRGFQRLRVRLRACYNPTTQKEVASIKLRAAALTGMAMAAVGMLLRAGGGDTSELQ